MKTQKIVLPIMAAAALAFGLAGCSKSESPTTAADDAAARTADAAKAAEAAKTDAAKAADSARAAAVKADAAKVETAKTADAAKVEAAQAADTSKAQGFIDKAKSLVAEGKFSDASSTLQQLTGLSLTPDQVKLVDALKEQIQKALAARAAENPTSTVGGLLK